MTKAPVKIDNLLEPLLSEISDEQADELLLRLITVHADPVIKSVIRYKLRLPPYGATERAESDDVYQEVILQLLGQLQQFRKLPGSHPISDLHGMAAVIAHRTCSRWIRRQFPERHALKNRLHYLLSRQPGLALWKDDNERLVAGFSDWREQKKPVCTRLPVESEAAHNTTFKSDRKQELADTVATVLNHAGGPVEFDDLVGIVATKLGVTDQKIESLDDEDNAVAFGL